ncbi:MAG: hypothetical protein AAGE94_20130 [Acidobacteriota bacterium]
MTRVATAVVAYRWGQPAQNHLIRQVWRPWVIARRAEGLVDAALFDRFDTRGPHVTLFVEWAGAAAERDAVRTEWVEHLCAELRQGIESRPDPSLLSADELAAHHAGCRGKSQCSIDRRSGFGEKDSIHAVAHPADGYPFGLTRDLPTADTVWDAVSDLALWAADQLPDERDGVAALAALGTVIAFDREMGARGDAEPFWQFYAGTLRLDLAERQQAGEALDSLRADLPDLIGAANQRRLAALWASADRLPRPPALGRLLDALGPHLRMSRECCHLVLKQLGWPVPHHVPAVLYAWWRAATKAEP